MTFDKYAALGRGGAMIMALFPTTATSQSSRIDVPVMITPGGGDACANGEIVGLDPKGDGFLSVRSGPGGAHTER